MSRVHEIDPADPGSFRLAVEEAAEALAVGLLVVLPTETVYGIAARPDESEATGRLFEAKRRPSSLNLPVLVPDPDSAWRLGRSSPTAERLARAFWPGPLTMVLRRTDWSAGWSLGARRHTIGLRVPDHSFGLGLLARTGPLAVTSANISGRPPLGVMRELEAAFGDQVAVYVGIRPGVAPVAGTPSTVVDLTGEDVRVVREGAIGRDRVASAEGRPGPESHSLD